jgi:2-phospho-L-lactate/phosphoenolpyruvate guanylyltransferase
VEHKVAFRRPVTRRHAYAHGVLAIVPFKGRDGAKTRLSGVLDADERAGLALELLERVLAACEKAAVIRRTLLVTPNPSALPGNVDILHDRGTGHANAIELALADPRARDGALVVMADCPLVDVHALESLALAARPLALVPSDDGGVNALALREANGFRPRFGVPAKTMIAAARAAGLEPTVLQDRRLAFDVDVPADLTRL